jgi:hypothetical protein
VKERDDRVPPEVEDYLVSVMADAGRMGGTIGGALGAGGAGALGGGRGGARGGERGGRRVPTVVVDRSGTAKVGPAEAFVAIQSALPKAVELPTDGRLRFVVPIGVTGLQRVVVDVAYDSGTGREPFTVHVRTYAKEGRISRHPATRMADEVCAALAP